MSDQNREHAPRMLNQLKMFKEVGWVLTSHCPTLGPATESSACPTRPSDVCVRSLDSDRLSSSNTVVIRDRISTSEPPAQPRKSSLGAPPALLRAPQDCPAGGPEVPQLS